MKRNMRHFGLLIMLVTAMSFMTGCGGGSTEKSGDSAPPPKSMVEGEDPLANKGIGPISSVALDAEINTALAAEGEQVYTQMCSACHKPDQKYIGPAPKGIMERRSPEWIMNMILNPVEMVDKDPIAKALLIEYNGAPMADQNLTEEQARAILEYFRTL